MGSPVPGDTYARSGADVPGRDTNQLQAEGVDERIAAAVRRRQSQCRGQAGGSAG